MNRILVCHLLFMVCAGALFANPGQIVRFPVGDEPWELAIGDFNRDGHLDCVTANSADSTLTVLFGDGNANFFDTTTYHSGIEPKVIVTGYFNNDPYVDLAVANAGPEKLIEDSGPTEAVPQVDQVAFFYGDSAGTFQNLYNKDVGDYPAGMAVGDFNEDGFQDIAVANYRSSNVMILRGRGNGTFVTQQTISTPGQPRAVRICDFDNDDHQDLVLGLRTSSQMKLLEGNGTGTFAVVDTTYEMYQFPRDIAVADVNSDGNDDYFGACRGNSRVGVYLGTGTHVLEGPVYYDCGLYPRYLTVADLDEDGRLDVLTSNYESNDMSYLMGYGDGRFRRWTEVPVGFAPRMVKEGDFDEDGHPDFAVAISGQDQLALLLGSPAFITPRLVSPADNDSLYSDPVFAWSAVPGARYFQIVLADEAQNFFWSKIVYDDTSTVYDGAQPLLASAPYTVYNWQVNQNTGGFFWDFTDPQSFYRFRTQGGVGRPVPRVPKGTAVALPEVFSWDGVEGARIYGVVVIPDSISTNDLWRGSTESEQILVPALEGPIPPDSTLFWFVVAFDANGNPGLPSASTRFRLLSSTNAPAAPVPLDPVQPDTVTQSPVTLVWSWPARATHFTVVMSKDPGFLEGPLVTWTFEDVTDSSLAVDLFPGVTDFYWRVHASNQAGESAPSSTARFAYTVDESAAVTSVSIVRPVPGGEYPFDAVLNELAILTGRTNAAVTGRWNLDGEVLSSFSVEMNDTAGVEVTGPPLMIHEPGVHTLQVEIVSPAPQSFPPASFTILPETAGPPAAIVVSADPQLLSADGVSTATIEAFVVDDEGNIVYSDSGRLISFARFGEADFAGGSSDTTVEGRAEVTLVSRTVPDSTIYVLALSDGLETGAALVKSYQGDYGADLSSLLAHVDRLSNLTLEIYEPPYDLAVDSYDQSQVELFIQERILGVEDPAEADKSAMRRLGLFERALHHGFHHEYDVLFPDPRVEPGQGALRMSDDLALDIWQSTLLSLESVRTFSHLVPLTKGSPALRGLIRQKARQDGLAMLRDFSGGLLENAGVSPTRKDLLQTFIATIDHAMTSLESSEEPLSLLNDPEVTSSLTRDFLRTIIGSSQEGLDSAAAWALRHNVNGSDSAQAQVIAQVLDVIDAFTGTDHEGSMSALSEAAVGLSLENMANIRYLFEKPVLSRNEYQISKSALESSFLPDRWKNIRESGDIASLAFFDAGYGYMGFALLESFIPEDNPIESLSSPTRANISDLRRKFSAPEGGHGAPPSALWEGILESMASHSLEYEGKARELMEALAAEDTVLTAALLSELIALDEVLSADLDRALAPAGAVLLYGTNSIPGFIEGYEGLKDLHSTSRYHRLMFVLQTYEYLLLPSYTYSGSMAIDQGSKAVDTLREVREGAIRLVTSLFSAQAYPLVFVSEVSVPDTLLTGKSTALTLTLENLGAGSALGVWVKLFATSGVEITQTDSAWVGAIGEGASIQTVFHLKAKRPEIPVVEPMAIITAVPVCANGLAYPLIRSVDLIDSGLDWNTGPLTGVPAESLVTIRITRPVGGEIVAGSDEMEITWNTPLPGIDHVAILFSADGGATYPDTVASSTENDSSWLWTVPVVSTDAARVKLVALSPDSVELAHSESPGNFTIDSTPPIVDVIFPDGGDTLYAGLQYEVRWGTSDDLRSAVQRRNNADASAVQSRFLTMHPRVQAKPGVRFEDVRSHGQEDATVSRVPAGDAVRKTAGLLARGTASPHATRDEEARVSRSLGSLLAPGDPFTVNLFYSTDSGSNWRVIALGEEDDSSFVWTVPGMPSGNCRVAVQAFDAAGNAGFASSDSDFVITITSSALARSRDVDEPVEETRLAKLHSKSSSAGQGPSLDGSPVAEMPVRFELFQNAPNPFNPVTSISFSVPDGEGSFLSLVIYDTRGKKIVTAAEGIYPAGWHTVVWNGKDSRGAPVGSGLYFYELRVGEEVWRRKMTLLR